MSFNKIKKEETAPLLSYAAIPPGSSLSSSSIPPPSYNQSPASSKEQPDEARGGSIPIVVCTVFLQSIGFTITLNSMYYYVQEVCIKEFIDLHTRVILITLYLSPDTQNIVL